MPVYSLSARLGFYLSDRIVGRWFAPPKISIVRIGDKRFKRARFPSAAAAVAAEQRLIAFGASPHLPPVVARENDEVWVEFIDGAHIWAPDEPFVRLVADLFAHIHARELRQVETAATPYPRRLAEDLEQLNRAGVLDDRSYRKFSRLAADLTPDRIWTGFDYSDPVLKNLVLVPDGSRVCAIDIESLKNGHMLGLGAAKACLRWMDPFRDIFFDQLARRGAPDIAAHFSYAELCFLTRWLRTSIRKKRWRRIDAGLLERLYGTPDLARGASGAPIDALAA